MSICRAASSWLRARRAGSAGRSPLACAARGATVVLHGRVVRKLETLYDEIVAAGNPQPTILPLDLATASADDFGQVAGAIRAQLGRLDGLVHTAAFLGSLGPVEHQSFDAWQKVLCVNLAAAMALTRSLLPLLSSAPDACVIFTLDVARRGSACLLGCVRRGQVRTFGSGEHPGGRVGKPAQPARQRRRSRTDAHAASRADASGRGSVHTSLARSPGAALSSSARPATQSGERRADRCAGVARRSCGVLLARRAGDRRAPVTQHHAQPAE